MKIEYYENMLEQEAINKYLNMIANDYNGELAKMFQEKYINKDKEIERLHSIIKEVREYIESFNLPKDLGVLGEAPISISELKHILDILEKEK